MYEIKNFTIDRLLIYDVILANLCVTSSCHDVQNRCRPVAGASFLGGISAWVKSLTDLKNAARVFIEISKKKKIQSDKKNTGNTNHKRLEHHRLKMKLTLTNV